MNEFDGLYEVRAMLPDDKAFILATFLRGVYYGDSWFSLIPKAIFMTNYDKVAHHLVTSPNVTVKVACLKEDSSVILGYIILSKDTSVLHWIYVKSSWRKHGIAKNLTPTNLKAVTHLSSLGETLMLKFPGLIFNPFAIT